MQLNIRPATHADLPAVHELVRELAEYEREAHMFTTPLSVYMENFAEGVFEAIVAEMEGRVVGMTLYYLTFSTWKGRMLYLEDFVVTPEFQRRGIGQQLFDAFLARAKELRCSMVKWQVLDWNTEATRFYERNGATVERQWWTCKIIF